MKKFLPALVAAAILVCAFPAEAQDESVDLIVLLDASQSMFPHFTEVVDFVVSRIARDYLRFGDTFHLLTFTDTMQIEIVQQVRTDLDLKSILGRLYLLHPFGRSTDLVASMSALARYAADLPEANRKLIVMVTDGMHNPSAISPNAALTADQVRSSLEETAFRIRARGWTFRIVRVPFDAEGPAGGAPRPAETPGTSPGAGDYLEYVAAALGTPVTDFTSEDREGVAGRSVELPRAAFPGHLGSQGHQFSFPLGLANPADRDLRLELSGVWVEGRDILARNIFVDLPAGSERTLRVPVRLPEDMEPGPVSLEAELRFEDGVRVVPPRGLLSLDLERRLLADIFRTTGTALLFLLLLAAALALIAALAFYFRALHRRAEEPVVTAVLDSEAAAAEARRNALASAPRREPHRVSAAEAKTYAAGLVPIHVNDEEAARYRDTSARDAAKALAAFAAVPAGQRAAQASADAGYVPAVRKSGSLRVEFLVQDQNPYIGLRNIRTLQAGGRKSIGGGRSDFLVFLVPVPPRIADVHFDGDNLTIVPVRGEFFTENAGYIRNCLDAPVRIVTRHGKVLTLVFRRYVPPLERLNRILHCVDAPGLPAVEPDRD